MRLVMLWDKYDNEIFVDIDLKRLAPPAKSKLSYFDAWMDSRATWGKPFLIICGAITAISILTMILKHL